MDSNTEKKNYKRMSDDEIQDYLKNCILIPKSKYTSLPDNSQICYFKNDGGFVKSGFIKLIYSKDGNDFIRYGSKFNTYGNDKYYKEFTINLSNVKELYKKIDQNAIFEYKIIKKDFTQQLTEYDSKIEELQTKIESLESQNKKIIKLIKKLHNITSIDDIK